MAVQCSISYVLRPALPFLHMQVGVDPEGPHFQVGWAAS